MALIFDVNHDTGDAPQVIADKEKDCRSKQPKRGARAGQIRLAQPADGSLLDSRRDEYDTVFTVREGEGRSSMALLDLDALINLYLHSVMSRPEYLRISLCRFDAC